MAWPRGSYDVFRWLSRLDEGGGPGVPMGRSQPRTIAATASAMAAVPAQPRNLTQGFTVRDPITLRFPARIIITAMIGTAITPLTTAVQNNAWIGPILVKLSATPPKVATTTMP